MAKLPHYTLSYDGKQENWKLENENTHAVIHRYATKEDATSRGVLRKAVRGKGGSVRIEYRYKSGYEEERTFPKSADPRASKG